MIGVGSVAVSLLMIGCAHSEAPAQQPPATAAQKPKETPVKKPANAPIVSPAEAQAFAAFSKRVEQYVELHNRLEATLPKLPEETTPQVIDRHQRALEKLISAERSTAKRGDVFDPEVEKIFRDHLARVFGGPDGRQLKASIMDENPVGAVKISVNGRYPDEVPLSTVPPQVLAVLPKLPEDIEYRFVGDRLVLLDVHAHIIVDFIDNALPA